MNGVPDPFSRLLVALEPWLDQVVIIGGWAHRLYRLHPAAQQLDYPPLTTLDTDIAVPLILPVREENIRARLLAHGFTEDFLGDDRPPATHYHLGGEVSGFYVEFLAPLAGGHHDREGKRQATVQIAGVTSQRLRHVDLLLHLTRRRRGHPSANSLGLSACEAPTSYGNRGCGTHVKSL